VDELDALVALEGLHHLLALAEAHEAGVDEHARELGPMALCTRAAATAESTPPDRAQMTRALAHLLADGRSTWVSMTEPMVHAGGQPHTS
jgi:hypothetical protein